MNIDNSKRAKLLIKKMTKGVTAKGGSCTYALSRVEKNMILYMVRLENRIKELEAANEKLSN